MVETANLGHKGTPVNDYQHADEIEPNSPLDFALGIFGLAGLLVCVIRKMDGNAVHFEAFAGGFLISMAVVGTAACATIAYAY